MRILLPSGPLASWPAAPTVRDPQHVPASDDWATLYPEIERLYVRERRKLRYIVQYMEKQHGFKAT